MKRTYFLLMFIVPGLALAQQHLQVVVPAGWVDVTEKVDISDTVGIPSKLVLTAENPVCRLLAADPKTFGDSSTTYLLQARIPRSRSFALSDQNLKEMASGIEQSLRQRLDMTLVEDKILAVNGKKVFRTIVEMEAPGNSGEKAQIRIVQYYLPDGNGVAAVSFYTPKEKAKDYMPIFEDAISKTLR